jgi:quercetin dioxygenase-like cupin family protein
MTRLMADAPYSTESFGRRAVVDEEHLLLMQIALLPGQEVPLHKANSNVHIIVLQGEVQVFLDGVVNRVGTGDLLPVAYGTPMRIRNDNSGNATFLVVKTPHPRAMEG